MGTNAQVNLLAVALLLALTGCGGGGGSKSNPPPPVSPPPTTPPVTPPVIPQPAIDAHLALTNAWDGRGGAYNGAGIRIGVVDSGVMRNHPALAGRVVASYFYLDPARNNANVDDVVGHGTAVAELAAGAPTGSWPGGIAPGAQIVSARIIADERPTDDGSGQGNEVDGALGFAPIHEDLIRAGVRIMNNSWGGLYWTRPTATAPIAAEYRPFIIDNDGLVVFATGNESRTNPSSMAALPSQPGPNGTLPAADLERGWLAVAALDTANPTQLASYSNACGVAKNYCLVAPGTAAYVSHDSTTGNLRYQYNSGTSFAAPLVSGAAALVWQKYPYFNNDLVRQTLLGSATDLGAPGPDAVFGYGLLNVGKSMRGPARLDWGDVHVVLPKGNSEPWWNSISGAGGLTIDGGGEVVDGVEDPTLSLSGQHTFTGGLAITGGATVSVNGSLVSDVTVGQGSYLYAWEVTLQGGVINNGVMQINSAEHVQVETRLNGDVVNNGVFFNRDFPHTTLGGDFTQSATGEYWTYLGTDPLHIEGSATLDGGLYIHGLAPGYIARHKTEILIADGGVNGEFAWQGYNAGLLLDATVGYGADRVWLDVDRADVATTALRMADISPASLSAARRVEGAFQAIDAVLQPVAPGRNVVVDHDFISAAAQVQRVPDVQALSRTLESLSGQAHAAATVMTFDSIDMNRRALSTQFAQSTGNGPNPASWMRSLGGTGQGGYLGNDYNASGWMMGQEIGIGGGVLGFAFGETRASTTAGGAQDRSRDRQAQSQLYAGWRMGQAYVLGQAGFGQYQREMDRNLLLGNERAGVHARYSGNFLSGSVEGGYRLGGQGGVSLTPYLAAEYTRIDNDAFREQGGYGFGLQAGGWSSSRTQALAGVRGQYLWRGLAVNGYAEWQHAFSANGMALDAGFVGIDAWAPLAGLQPARSGGLLGLSLDSWLSRNTRLSLGYDQRFGTRKDIQQVALRLSQAF